MILLQPSRLQAAPAEWLFDVTVPAAERSAAARQQAGKLALKILLKRLTGMKDIPPDARISTALKNPEVYIIRYSYHSNNPLRQDQTVLNLGFDPVEVQKLIRAAGLPNWSSHRPRIVAWVVVERNGSRELLSAQSRDPLALTLQSEAAQRGLPVTLPLMDLEDQLEVSASVVWGGLTQVLVPASVRYQADAILVGRVRESKNGWSGHWDYYENRSFSGNVANQDQHLDVSTQALEDSAIAAVDFVTSDLAMRYAVRDEMLHHLWFRVAGIRNISAYAAAMRYFEHLQYLHKVQLSSIRRDTLVLSLTTQSPWRQLRTLLALDGKVKFHPPQLGDAIPYGSEGYGSDSAHVKQFVWLPADATDGRE